MNTFKSSAIQVLKKAGKPLYVSEITRLALEGGILVGEMGSATITDPSRKVRSINQNSFENCCYNKARAEEV